MIRRRSWLVGAGAVVVLLLLVAGWLVWRWTASDARPVGVADAGRRFHQDHADALGASTFVPAEGVYRYRGSGSESISKPARSQAEGPEMPGTVTRRDDGCWTFRLDYSTNHWREWSYCTGGSTLVETGGREWQRWDFVAFAVDNLSVTACAPPALVLAADLQVGAVWSSECRGTNTAAAGETVSTGDRRYLGPATVEVAGTPVPVLHLRDQRRIRSAQQGSETTDFWITPEGLPVRVRQRIVVRSDSQIGRVTYHQAGHFTLASPSPVG
ncbi:MAG: hypothetical protein WCI50_06400 [Actinomycetes bacterium]